MKNFNYHEPPSPTNPCAFVTGLPRTRTAWWSALLNAHNNPLTNPICAYHELATKVESQDEYYARLKASFPSDELIVDCSSRISYIQGSKLLIVRRSPEDSARSLMKLPLFANIDYQYVLQAVDRIQLLVGALIVETQAYCHTMNLNPSDYIKVVDYRKLNDSHTVADCLIFLGVAPNHDLIQQMQEFNIQAQYLNTITLEEFYQMGAKVNSIFELNLVREMENINEKERH